MEGEDIENLQRALQKVSYINSRQFPTAGIRHLKVSSKVQCFGEDTCITVPNIDAYVSVLQANEPRITINGMDHFARPAVEFESAGGVMLLPDIRIVSTVTRMDNRVDYKDDSPGQNPIVVEEMTHNLDFCDILVIGEELNPEQECLELNRSALNGKHLDATNSTRGYSIYGVDSMQSYEQALRQVRYRNWQTDSIFDRKFRVKCSELNGRYTSNEFNLEVNMLHNSNVMEHVNNMAVQPQFLQTVHHPVTTINVSPGAATVVIVVCISILVIIITLGIFRIRESHQLSGQGNDGTKGSEMDWDDSALTITVNPMEKYDAPQEEDEESEDEDDYDIEDDDDEEETSSDESDESEEEEEEETGREAVQHRACRQEQRERHTSALHY